MVAAAAKLYQVQQVKILEQLLMQKYAVSAFELMERAGGSAFNLLRQHWPDARSILVFCGKGNNGGDGYVLARLAKQAGLTVEVCQIEGPQSTSPVAYKAWLDCQAAGVNICQYEHLESTLKADVIVDALLGIGIKSELSAVYAAAVAAINAAAKPVLSIDVPSGIDADTGRVCGSAVHASVTLTFIAMKCGLLTGASSAYRGDLKYDALVESPDRFLSEVTTEIELLDLGALLTLLSPRNKDAHKGNFGHVLIIGGNRGMLGAVRLAGEAAARVGAGLVSLATRKEHAAIISSARPELMCHGVEGSADLSNLLAKVSVLVIGPGLGQDDWAQQLFSMALAATQLKILDADALNLLAKNPIKRDDWILTPHPGEAARLLKCSVADIGADRFAAIKELKRRYGGVIVLKGSGTLIELGGMMGVCPFGNPGMATGGMGDVLSGVLGGLIAQGLTLAAAAQLGVLLHSKAADTVAFEQGERGMLALDLMPVLGRLVNHHHFYGSLTV